MIFLTGLLTCLALIVAIGAQSLFIMRQAIRRDRLVLTLAVCLAGDIVLVFSGTAGIGVITERAPWLLWVLTWGGVAYLLWFALTSFRSALSRQRTEPSLPDAGPAEDTEGPAAGAGPGGDAAGAGGVPTRTGAEEDVVAAGAPGGGPTAAVTGGAPAVVLATKPAPAVRIPRSRTGQEEKARLVPGTPGRALTPVHIVVLTALSVSVLNPHAILDTVVMLGTLANSYGADKWVFAAGAVTGSALWFLTLGLGVRALAPLLDTPRTWRIVDWVVGVVMLFIAAGLAMG
ncbi:MAG: LysE family transporter [Micrococcus sp.]|nr:LysE family transporter [Micrococcus sp.]